MIVLIKMPAFRVSKRTALKRCIAYVSIFPLVFLSVCGGSHDINSSPKSKPNILLITVDDLGPRLSCYNYDQVLTPNIDNLALQSLRFQNAFIQQALCGPSRTSLLTSRRPDTTRLYNFDNYWRDKVGNYTTLPQYFKQHGYYSVSIGKIFHNGKCSGPHQDYPYSWSEVPYIPSTMKWRRKPVCPGPGGKLYENLLCAVDVNTQPESTLPDIQNSDRALQFLANYSSGHSSEPFFLGVGFYKPHVPFKFPKEYLDLYPLSGISPPPDPRRPPSLPPVAWNPWADIRERHDIAQYNISFPYGPVPKQLELLIRQHYYASTTYMDYQVGRLLHGLESYVFAENTIIAFLGDHGWSLGEHQEWSKYSLYDEATRVPLMLYSPRLIGAGIRSAYPRFPLTNLLKSHDSKLRFASGLQKSSNLIFGEERKSPTTMSISSGDALIIDEFVEAVDLFPTLVDLANLTPIAQCPADSLHTILCTEGSSMAPLIRGAITGDKYRWKNATFSQYPRPADLPQMNSDQPKLKDIRIMGYSIRTKSFRYSEWVGFRPDNFSIHWDELHASELYDLRNDPHQGINVASDVRYIDQVMKLSKALRAGWRGALPDQEVNIRDMKYINFLA